MSHISFSALKIWKDCAFKYKLNYIDGVQKFSGNEYTAFGTAIHEACERKVQDPQVNEVEIFKEKFTEELSKFPEETIFREDVNKMREQGIMLASLVYDELKRYFGNFTLVSAEEELLLPIENTAFEFKGYVDLIVKTDDGKYHIIDYKTCSWGWDAQKKNDALTNYQLTLYKHFFGNKNNLDPKDIETHFVLLKRTAKKAQIEPFRVTSGPKKVQNALKVLNNAVHNISIENFPKNKLNCKNCEFYKTPHCP